MAVREAKPKRASAHVTVYTEDGTPVQYPKAQVHRIKDSKRLFLDDPTEVDISFPSPQGGGWYVLSDGSRVKGKDNARDQQKELER